MNKVQFLDTLTSSMSCQSCGKTLRTPNWLIEQFGEGEWSALNLVTCSGCGYNHLAAAGSSDRAHRHAQNMRSDFFEKIHASPEPKKDKKIKR